MEPRPPSAPADMTLTVLGASASCPDAGDACSGYLVRQGETALLVDCGSGVLGTLRREIGFDRVNAILISHFHPDHFLDLVPMRYGLRYDIRAEGGTAPIRPRLFVPPGGIAYLAGLGTSLRNNPRFFADAFQLAEYDPATTLDLDGIAVTFQRTTHDEPTWAMALTGRDGARLVYTADTKESPEVERFAAHADLLLCESTYPAAAGAHTDGSGHHLSSLQAGELARRAHVRRLMLTHFWPGIPRQRFLDDAERAFGAPAILAQPGLTVPIAPSTSATSPGAARTTPGSRSHREA
ncbi:MAG: MBL fold metallo-hydrolase [Thermomicrobiales bacterium]